MHEYLDKLLALPPFFFVVIAILLIGMVFSLLKRVIKFSLFLALLAILVFVVFVVL